MNGTDSWCPYGNIIFSFAICHLYKKSTEFRAMPAMMSRKWSSPLSLSPFDRECHLILISPNDIYLNHRIVYIPDWYGSDERAAFKRMNYSIKFCPNSIWIFKRFQFKAFVLLKRYLNHKPSIFSNFKFIILFFGFDVWWFVESTSVDRIHWLEWKKGNVHIVDLNLWAQRHGHRIEELVKKY